MTSIPTVNGSVDADDLGRTLMHEHVFVLDMEIEGNYPGRWNEDVRVADAIARLQSLADRGIDTIVDMTVVGLGRDVRRIEQVAAAVPLNIVAATGLYIVDSLPVFFRHRGPGTLGGGDDLLERFFIDDIEQGIGGTSVKAAVLKCATDREGVTPDVERVVRVVGRAQRATGVPISTHTDATTQRGLDQQRILKEEGVDLGRVVIGHSGDTTDLDYLRALIDNGSYVGLDRFGVDPILPLEDRIDVVVRLCEQGYADRMVLSHDFSCFTHNIDLEVRARVAPRWRYECITDDVLPALRAAGVSDADIERMLVHNPRDLLTRTG